MKALLILAVIVIGGLAGFTWITLHWTYSSGERAGYVQKFAKKGWVCKTWEGEMAMVNIPGTLSEKFIFTVKDDTVAAQVNKSLGKRVALQYDQHRWLPSSCLGDSEYFVSAVHVME